MTAINFARQKSCKVLTGEDTQHRMAAIPHLGVGLLKTANSCGQSWFQGMGFAQKVGESLPYLTHLFEILVEVLFQPKSGLNAHFIDRLNQAAYVMAKDF